ncbi:MAG TPA: Gfo/Idh/MocA family oxidoreductase [Chitinophagaceae bacterium]|nr:Gfo/Idh/MocA family oxidoreductase [Chitinophagaceae bacterium]
MIKVGLIGAGKMGISHLSILGAHPDVEVVGVSDPSKLVTDILRKYTRFSCYTDYKEMLRDAKLEAVFVAAPTKYHAEMVRRILDENMHVFVEKPLCITAEEGEQLAALAAQNGLINQVGYHNKFIGTFRETKKIIQGGFLGNIFHFIGEAYGPVVTQKKQNNWRADPEEGGGCLMDYASHVIDLINDVLGPIDKIRGSMLKSFYSKKVEDAVFAFLETKERVTGQLSVNWSDDTYRKMSTSITVHGSAGKIICDANELKVFFRTNDLLPGYSKGWNIKSVADLSEPVNFYLRGEEYSAQVDYFIRAIQKKVPNSINNFQSAWHTDRVISWIKENAK